MATINCNQCNTPFKKHVYVDCSMTNGQQSAYVCNNPECPNFALLQMALEDLPTPDEE